VSVGPNAYIGSGAIVGKGPAFAIKGLNPSAVSNYFIGKTSLASVMAIYIKDKPIQQAPDVIDSVQKYWQQQILATEQIFLVGVNPNLEDEHIWKCLSQTKTTIYFCGDRKAFDVWQRQSNRADNYLSEYFEDAIDDMKANLR